MIQYLEPYSDFSVLTEMLGKINIPNQKNIRFKGLTENRFLTFGLVKNRIKQVICPSAATKKYPHIYEELVRIGKEIVPFEFTSIHINKNVVCPPHKDAKVNRSMSVIVSFGDYEGCNLIVEDIEFDVKEHPALFDGRTMMHWNTPLIRGNKYSLIFYSVI